MSYRLHAGSALDKEVRRIAREQLGKAAARLEANDGDRDVAIHDARKHFKKVRGLYRLVRSGDSAFGKRENVRIRDMAAMLSGMRDAIALIETVDDLSAHLPAGTVAEELSVVRGKLVARRERLLAQQDNGLERMAAAADGCRGAVAVLDELALSRGRKAAPAIVADGWRRTCKRAARALAACKSEGRKEDYHALRKRVKDHAMHCRLLRDLWPTPMTLRRRSADGLAKTIGAEHDLTLLAAFMASDTDAVGGPAARQSLERLVGDRRAELRAEALKHASLLFAGSAKREAKRVALLLRHAAS